MNKKILVGVAWPYVNGDLHIGHLAGNLLPPDIFARYHRLCGNDVLMVSGSDCYGTPTTIEADKKGITPHDVVELYHPKDMELFRLYGLSYNLYTKTATANHERVVQEIFLQLLNNGFISKGVMQQYYSSEDKQFLPDRYVEGTCVHCGAHDQRSDQCENCGRWLQEGELTHPKSKLTGKPVELKDTEHYFLEFAKFEPVLRKYLDSKKGIWREWIWKESDGWLREGLKKRAITRDLDWGVQLPTAELQKLPEDLQLSSYESKRIYVWFEAVIGYLSAAQEWTQLKNENAEVIFSRYPEQSADWREWWQNTDAEIYNFMGQDNLVFHTLMWPAELMGTKQGYTLPHNVVVNKFMNYENKKFSKSRNWTIDSKQIATKYGVDPVRYYIASNFPENKEGNFVWECFVDAINSELVGNFGNLVNRTLKFLEARFESELNESDFVMDVELAKLISETFVEVGEKIGQANLVEALNKIMALSKIGNQYFDQQEVWQVIKTDEKKARDIILNLLNLLTALNTMIMPYLPTSAAKLAKMLGNEQTEGHVGENKWRFEPSKTYKIASPVEPLFQKLDKETVLAEKEN
jgi:methionyl-tRNA synthetase